MKVYLYKDEQLKLTDSNGGKMDLRVFQMETPVTNLQPSDNRVDPEHKEFCADLTKKLCHLALMESVRNRNAKKPRIERKPTLKISMDVPNKVSEKDHENRTVIKIDGGFITALRQMYLSLPVADVRVKLTLLTDLIFNFSVTTDEMPILYKTEDSTECCNFDFYMPELVRNTLMKDDNKLSKIGGKFTIEIILSNFEENLVSLKTLNHTILNDSGSADMVIFSGDGKEIPCHRVFLSVHSVVLKAMVGSSFQESSGKIKMPDMSEKGVRAFLAFLYNRDLVPAKETISIVWELLNAGEKYNVIPLRTSAEKILLESDKDSWWTVEAALQIFAFMNEIDSDLKEDVKKKIIQVMKRNYRVWMSSEVYQKMLKENPTMNAELLKVAFSLCSCDLPTKYVTVSDDSDESDSD